MMSAKMKKMSNFDQNVPQSVAKDELDDYIRYQDGVLERNAEEMIQLIEGQENELDKLQDNQEMRTERLYLKKDQLDPIEEKLERRLDVIDSNMFKRISQLDKKTDDYMDELARRNARWKNQLEDIGTNLAKRAENAHQDHADERKEQKVINRDYRPQYSDAEAQEVWDAGDISPMDNIAKKQQRTIPEAHYPAQKIPTGGSPRPRARSKAHREQIFQKHNGGSGQVQRQSQEQGRAVSKQKASSNQSRGGQGRKQVSQPNPTPGQAQEYPCPVCQKPLFYHEKFRRWWCRSCKKWQ